MTEIEKLFVSIGADVSDLLKDSGKAIDEVEDDLKGLEKQGKKTFTGLDKWATKFGKTMSKVGAATKKVLKALVVAAGAAGAALAAVGAGIVLGFKAAERGIESIRIRRSFNALAASANQSGEEILAAMKSASAGVINETELMRRANLALQLGVARTPEEFEKLTRSALILGRALGKGPTQALDDLITAAGRRSVQVLDNLGLSISAVNQRMEELAQQEFGQAAASLDVAQRNALFMQAALDEAAFAADKLGGEIKDLGGDLEKARADIENFQSNTDEAFTVVVGRAIEIVGAMKESFFGSEGVFPLFTEGGNVVAEVFAGVLSGFLAIAGSIVKTIVDAKKVLAGELSITEFSNITERIAENYRESFAEANAKIREDFAEVFDPAAGAGAIPPIIPPEMEEEATETAAEIQNILDRLGEQFIDATEAKNEAVEKLTTEHGEKMVEIEENSVEKRIAASEKLNEELTELDKETAQERAEIAEETAAELAELDRETNEERADILRDTREELARIERDTDQRLADERASFQKDEKRETEDHLQEMRAIRQRFLMDIESAVKTRDARALKDARLRFQQESQATEEQFSVEQTRDREDQDLRLQQIRQDEERRATEILANQEQELQELAEHEAKKRAEIQRSQQEQLAQLEQNRAEEEAKIRAGFEQELATIDEKNAEALIKEQETFEERQAELDAALAKRLESVAKELSDEKEITEAGARDILSALNDTFGAGGDIDRLIEDFQDRRRQKLTLQLTFEEQTEGERAPGRRGGEGRQFRAFAEGGTMITDQPTLALFGEKGPEFVQAIPMNRITSGNMSMEKTMNLNLALSGSAPPGVRSADRDAIAGTLVSALREAGLK